MYDVLIIGAGMAGLMAAIQAAEKGKKVCLVAKGQGAINLTSGTIDILGNLPNNDEILTDNLSSHLADLIQAQLEHPYSKAGIGFIQEGIKAFTSITGKMGYPYQGNGEVNYLLPTAFGTIRPTALVPKTMEQGDIRFPGDVLVIGFEELMDFPARLIAEGINGIREDLSLQGQWKSLRMALGLEANNLAYLAKVLAQEAAFKELIEKIKAEIAKFYPDDAKYRIAIPAIFGLDYNLQLFDRLQASLGCPVFEIPFGQPTIPGIRLNNLLLDYAKGKGVEIRLGTEVLSGSIGSQSGEIIVNSAARPITLKGKQIVLATGGSFGKGIICDSEGYKESIFNLSIQGAVEHSSPGIRVDDNFQPVLMSKQADSSTEPVQKLKAMETFDSLKVVGRNLAAYDPVKEKSGLGVALVSGYAVGTLIGGGDN